MGCRCTTVDELHGDEAEAYLADHLKRADGEGYSCPDTGTRWHLDYPDDTGQPRLRAEPFSE